ncbi:glucose-6-phosphate dehydrogenase (NADP(+)) [Candidatus Pacearchaeota archaeon]|nr:glucose-6-phosphate dehydrogenase (NADP(+)) [Candidatus Pacearchaeota archaeon]
MGAFVIFGATGDLTRRKLLPALVRLQEHKQLVDMKIICVGRRAFVTEQYKEFLKKSMPAVTYESIESLPLQYLSLDFSVPDSFKSLHQALEYADSPSIFYLATNYLLFPEILAGLRAHGLEKTSKIVFEKPFGSDSKSARKLDALIHSVFPEERVYRIDHYSAKETVLDLEVLKFTNPVFEAVLNKKHVARIEVCIDEELGVGERLGYYHGTGALKDMVQSHLLQVLSLVLMRKPKNAGSTALHDEKLRILKKLKVLDPSQHLLGQYDSYQQEAVQAGLPARNTETFARVALECMSAEWKGVPLILQTGKKLPQKRGQIRIYFKQIPSLLKGALANELVIDIYPKQDIYLLVNTRKQGMRDEATPIQFEFSREKAFGPNTPDEYATLLNEVFLGNQMFFPRGDEVLAAWKVIEQVEHMRDKILFMKYPDGVYPAG